AIARVHARRGSVLSVAGSEQSASRNPSRRARQLARRTRRKQRGLSRRKSCRPVSGKPHSTTQHEIPSARRRRLTMSGPLYVLALVCGYTVSIFIGILGLLIVWRIVDGTIDLSRLISEPNGDASMSRFQFLVFTFVI